ncbi:hypothetical protein FHW88_002891 [Mucilaginibacter sp. SG538B]|nr:hypothetical protein [Mucilaginibacter sp. SG538B]
MCCFAQGQNKPAFSKTRLIIFVDQEVTGTRPASQRHVLVPVREKKIAVRNFHTNYFSHLTQLIELHEFQIYASKKFV